MIKKKNKIIFITSSPFSINAFIKNHLINLAESFEIVLIVNKDLDNLSNELIKKIRVINVKLKREINIYYDFINFFKLMFLFVKEKPDIVFSMTSKIGFVSMILGFCINIPVRVHIFTGFIWYNKIFILRFFFKLIDKIICRFATNILVDSKGQVRLLNKEISNDKNITLLGNGSISGVDTKRFIPHERLYSKERKKIKKQNLFVYLYVGRITNEKGVPFLIDIFKDLYKELHNIELWIVGPDEEHIMRDYFSNQTNKFIKYYGKSSSPELYMAKSDILVLPSHREGFGNVIIEAASCALPTIAYNIDGPKEIIKNNITGYLVKKYSKSLFKSKMSEVYFNKQEIKKIGLNARNNTIKLYDRMLVEKAWVNYFQKLKIKSS